MATFHNNNTCVFSHHDDNHKTTTTNNNNNNNNHCVGSGFTKQQRSDDHQHFQPNKSMSLRSHSLLSLSPSPSPSPSPADANNMLSFSTSSSSSSTNTPKDGLFSFYQPSHSYIRNTGYGYGYGGPVSRYNKGPFTPSQWMELEHQALIYKHFVANVPVPSNLLNPIRKSLNTFLFPGSSSSTSYSPGSFGWGTFHLGFAGPADPEPGRCRRTDGKKWRCSRDAVPDQKYCERHINRGRHRSRKPVESQNGQAVSGPTASKAGPVISASSVPVSTALSTAKGAILHRDNHNPHAIASSPQTPINRTQEPQAFGINSSSVYPTNYGSFLDHGAYASNPNPLPGFVDEWSKDEPLKPDWTQLSMSIPMASSDFSSSSNSPAQEKQASNWIPISWGNSSSMGGPLGEVLNRTCSSGGLKSKNPSSGSEEMSEMWDAIGYHIGLGSGSSPTGVLQKTTFVSLSNSSSGSSPKKDEHGDRLLLSTLASIT